ncbi:MAG: stage II sporulation protein M [Planctomycetaceae bacterium]
MKVADVIAARAPDWHALEEDVTWLRTSRGTRLAPDRVAAFARRYRAACSDLALATGARFPEATIDYLQQLVADAHTQLYRIESFSIVTWARSLLVDVPRRTITDPCTWIAAVVFVVLFGGGMTAAWLRPQFATDVVGDAALAEFESMYAERPGSGGFTSARAVMAGFYVFNNAGIGLRCFAGGILFGVGSLVVLAFNGLFLGTVFGHMLASPSAGNFGEFVTAHAPFELTAIVLSAAAGLRLGWALVDTAGWGRWESLRRTAPAALGTAGLATVLFILAAYVEAFVSPSTLPWSAKAAVASACGLGLVALFASSSIRRGGARHEG